MTNEKILERLYKLILSLPEDEQKNAEYFMKDRSRFDALFTPAAICTDLIKDLQDDIKTEEAKKSGKGTAKRAAERVLKQLNDREYHGAFMCDGVQYIGGRYTAVRLVEPLPVVEIPEGKEHPNYKSILDGAKQNDGEFLTLPSRAELSAFIKSDKAAHKGQKGYIVSYDFGESLPLVKAEFLLDIIDILGDCTARMSSRNPIINALYFSNEKGEDGVLMPVRK